jgi:hypothetical protein
MCDICNLQFEVTATKFDEWLKHCRIALGQPRATPATTPERVHDRAMLFAESGDSDIGNWINAWYLALAVERLLALESAGIPT